MSDLLSNLGVPSLSSLLPSKVLSEKSTKVEFKAWYEKIMNYLCCYGLDGCIKLSVKSLENDEEDAKSKKSNKSGKGVADLEQKSWLAYTVIMSRLDDALIVQFSTLEKGNAAALMNAIKGRFSAVNFFSKLQARRDFNRIKLKANESISSYGARIKYGAKELELMDSSVKVNEMELISRLVDGLPEEYDVLIVGLVRGIETITFDEFVQILESKCSLSRLKGGSSDSSPSANAAAAAAAISDGKKFYGRCFKCKQVGHRSVDCNRNKLVDPGDYLAGTSLRENSSNNGGPDATAGVSVAVDLDTLLEGGHDPGTRGIAKKC
jgi:hypothetical protein